MSDTQAFLSHNAHSNTPIVSNIKFPSPDADPTLAVLEYGRSDVS